MDEVVDEVEDRGPDAFSRSAPASNRTFHRSLLPTPSAAPAPTDITEPCSPRATPPPPPSPAVLGKRRRVDESEPVLLGQQATNTEPPHDTSRAKRQRTEDVESALGELTPSVHSIPLQAVPTTPKVVYLHYTRSKGLIFDKTPQPPLASIAEVRRRVGLSDSKLTYLSTRRLAHRCATRRLVPLRMSTAIRIHPRTKSSTRRVPLNLRSPWLGAPEVLLRRPRKHRQNPRRRRSRRPRRNRPPRGNGRLR